MRKIGLALTICLLAALACRVSATELANMYSDFSSEQGYRSWYYNCVKYDAFTYVGGQWRDSLGFDTISRDNWAARLKMTARAQNGVVMSWHYAKTATPAWFVATITPYGTWDTGCNAEINLNQWWYNGMTCKTIKMQDYMISQNDQPLTVVMPVDLSSGDAIDFEVFNTGASGSCNVYVSGYVTDVAPPGVPEPSALLALGAGVLGLAGYARKRKN